jgi:antitoxin Phd
MKNVWQLQDAKSRFSQVVEDAIQFGVQIVTRHGKNAVVVLSYRDYERLLGKKQTLSGFLKSSPLAGSDLDVDRAKELIRDIEVEE